MRRGFVHVEIGREHPQCGIAPLKALHIFIKYFRRKLSVLCFCPHIVFVAYLQNNLMEWLLLFAGTDFLIIIINYAVTSGLLLIVPGKYL